MGDSLRRIAETEADTWRSEVMEPLLAAGYTTKQVGEARTKCRESGRHSTRRRYSAVYRAQLAHVWTANIIHGMREAPSQRPGCTTVSIIRPPCASSTSPVHPPDPGARRRRGCRSGNEPGRLVERTRSSTAARPVKWLGDGVMFFFQDPARRSWPPSRWSTGVAEAGLPPAHVGLHAGPVVFQEGDYYGQTVNLASRIADYARPGEVLVSQEVVDAADGSAVAFREIGPVELKGVGGAMRLHAASASA